MSDTPIEDEVDREIRQVSSRVVVWVAVAAGIGMAVLQAVRTLRRRKTEDG
ncbi:MAG: hypothetical protein K1X95_05845 [Acidimicrobiia bacterium]|nr:hypothetical protein [Acidimicrobiia bacterium]